MELRVAGGIYQQPPTFPLLLPGIDTFALQLGLQRQRRLGQPRVQAAGWVLGTALGLLPALRQLHRSAALGVRTCSAPPPASLSGAAATLVRLTDGQAYGLGPWSAAAEVASAAGSPTPSADRSATIPAACAPLITIRHTSLNVVVQARLPYRIDIGARLYVATGRPDTVSEGLPQRNDVLADRNNIRLPNFVELDLRIDKYWQFPRFTWRCSWKCSTPRSQRACSICPRRSSRPTPPAPRSPGPPTEVGFRWSCRRSGCGLG